MDNKKRLLIHLKQAQGMINKVTNMVEEDSYCIKVLQQSLATIGFIKSANKIILKNHLNCCFRKGMLKKGSRKQNALIQEIVGIMDKT